MVRLGATLALALLAAACGSQSRTATQVLVRISAERAALDATKVRVRILGGRAGHLAERRVVDLKVEDGWPIELAIEPSGGDANRKWQVDAWALGGSTELGAGTVEGGFENGKLIEEVLVLKPGVELGAVPEPTPPDHRSDGGAATVDSGPAPTHDAAVVDDSGAASDAHLDGSIAMDAASDAAITGALDAGGDSATADAGFVPKRELFVGAWDFRYVPHPCADPVDASTDFFINMACTPSLCHDYSDEFFDSDLSDPTRGGTLDAEWQGEDYVVRFSTGTTKHLWLLDANTLLGQLVSGTGDCYAHRGARR